MRILFEVTHPAHVHLFRHTIQELRERGDDVFVASREKDITTSLLDHYGIDHTILSSRSNGIFPLLAEWSVREVRSILFYRSIDPDIVISRFNPTASTVSSLLRIPHLVFEDTEVKPGPIRYVGDTFSDVIYTPECFQLDLGENQIRYPGYHELAYLHPERFEPDSRALEQANIDPNERFVILRLVAWDAIHDAGDGGFDNVVDLVEELESTGATVRITSEADLPSAVADRAVSISPHRIHDLMAFADVYVGESATMATESAVLGTPAVFVSSNTRGYTDELEDEYGLVFNFPGGNRHENGIGKATKILDQNDAEEWESRRQKLLSEKIDVTGFILDEIDARVSGQGE